MYKKLLKEVIKATISNRYSVTAFDVDLKVDESGIGNFKVKACDQGVFYSYEGYVGTVGQIEVMKINGHYAPEFLKSIETLLGGK